MTLMISAIAMIGLGARVFWDNGGVSVPERQASASVRLPEIDR